MNRLLVIAFLLFAASLFGQVSKQPWSFKEVKSIAATPVKNQQQTGTCWSFSATSFLESELLRTGKGEVDLSEMWVVRHIYRQKCANFMRRQGKTQFGEGGLGHDQIDAIREFGIVPEAAFSGKKDPAAPHNHSELEAILTVLMKTYVERGMAGKLSDNWQAAIDGVLDAYFGERPASFEFNGKTWTPKSWAENLGLGQAALAEYVTLTSFTHRPFFTAFPLEIPDNWASGPMQNLPLDELMRCLRASLDLGMTIEWDADVSNKGFNHKLGLALVPEAELSAMSETDRAAVFANWTKERVISQEYRQKLFENLTTADDHLMHITGQLTDQEGGAFYLVKNSWGDSNPLHGFVQVSEAYMRLNTISFMVHRSAIPADLRKKLNL